jgi:hypothetical protein
MGGEQLLRTDLSNFGSPAQKTQSLPRLCEIILLAVFEFESVICDHAQSFIEVALHLSPVQQAVFLDPFHVGKVAERSEPKNLQEFLRRTIDDAGKLQSLSERREGQGGANRVGDQCRGDQGDASAALEAVGTEVEAIGPPDAYETGG